MQNLTKTALPSFSDKDTLRTCLSRVDGEQGVLTLLGIPLAELTQRYAYTQWAHILWSVYAPDPGEVQSLNVLNRLFCNAQDVAYQKLYELREQLTQRPAISALRLGLEYVEAETPTEITMTLMTSLLLHLHPEAEFSSATDPLERFLEALQLTGSDPLIREKALALQTYLMTVSDHGFNASTYTARVIASTGSDFRACVQGALGALQGPLHGGAPGPVLDMLDAVATADSVSAWVQTQLDQGARLMGFGHRIYRVRDPRADVLKATLKALQGAGFESQRLQAAEHLESVALALLSKHKPDRALETNVEYYTALLLESLGFPRESFTAIFALGRVLGWCAHAQEQQALGRLIRPTGAYFENELLISR